MRIEAAFKVFMMLLVVWIMMWAQFAWCAEPVKGTLKITVKSTSKCAGGKCQVRQYSVPVQINAPACKNGKCNLQQRKVVK